jgi:CRP-like cAMP-binding protein
VVIRFRPYDGGALDLANIPAGGAFGWSAALKRSYYTSAAIARTDVQALFIEASDLHRLMANDPELGRKLLEHTARQAALRPQVFTGQHPPARKPRLAQKASRIG